jgi:hypothetical protein
MSNAIDLTRFCGDATRGMGEPCSVAGGTFATNGHVAVWIPATCANKPMDKLAQRFADVVTAAQIAAADTAGIWIPATEIQLAPRSSCSSCDGSGYCTSEPCDECEDGEFWHGSHTYECKACDGAGRHVVAASASEGATRCDDCRGTGTRFCSKTDFPILGNPDWTANAMYVALLRDLPDCALRTELTIGNMIPFRFSGGFGALMPLAHAPLQAAALRSESCS